MTFVAAALGVAGCTSRLTPEAAVGTLAIANRGSSGVSLAADGPRVVAAWAATSEGTTDIYAAVSEDGGATFGAPVRVNDLDGDARVSGEQPPRVAIGHDVVVVWASRAGEASRIRLARSTDNARSFLPAITLHEEPLTGARGWQSVAIGPDGAVHALWLDGRNAAAMTEHHHDGAAAAPAGPTVAKAAMDPASPRQDIVEATWTPDGATETHVASNVCFCCKTAIALGPDHALYAAWRHIYPNSMRDIAVARSTDNGRTFGEPTRVSVDNWQLSGCPDDGPSMVVDASNVIHVVWPTLVPGPTPSKGIFYVYSVDGGRSFSSRRRLDNPQGTSPAHPSLVLDGQDLVVGWDDLSPAKERRVRLRRLIGKGRGPSWRVTPEDPLLVNDAGPASYPSLAMSGGNVVVAWTEEGADRTAVRVRRFAR